jgi:hypothetical protein
MAIQKITQAQQVAPVQQTWIVPTMLNGWVDYDPTVFNPTGYYKDDDGIVHLRGLVKTGALGTIIFTLPAGYRPAKQIICATIANNQVHRLDVTNTGSVTTTAGMGTNAFLSIDNIHFRAEL